MNNKAPANVTANIDSLLRDTDKEFNNTNDETHIASAAETVLKVACDTKIRKTPCQDTT